MSLRLQAAADARVILENTCEFGWQTSVTNPDGHTAEVTGFTTDVSQSIDPGTGQAVSGAVASVAFSIASLNEQGLGMPVNVHDEDKKPWVVVFADPSGITRIYRVTETLPDRALGVVVCMLESYRPEGA